MLCVFQILINLNEKKNKFIKNTQFLNIQRRNFFIPLKLLYLVTNSDNRSNITQNKSYR